jgi:hypothetical protein
LAMRILAYDGVNSSGMGLQQRGMDSVDTSKGLLFNFVYYHIINLYYFKI